MRARISERGFKGTPSNCAVYDQWQPLGQVPMGAHVLSDKAWAEVAASLKLSPRELELTRGVFDNLTDGAIAAKLGISEHTAHAHFRRLHHKLRVTTRAQLVLRIMAGILQLTLSDGGALPPICPHYDHGHCAGERKCET